MEDQKLLRLRVSGGVVEFSSGGDSKAGDLGVGQK